MLSIKQIFKSQNIQVVRGIVSYAFTSFFFLHKALGYNNSLNNSIFFQKISNFT